MPHFELFPSPPKDDLQVPASPPIQVGSEVAIQNILWFITLRWIAVAVFLAVEITAALFGPALRTNHGIEVPNQWPWILAVTLALANLCFFIHARRLTIQTPSKSSVYLNIWSQIVVDLLTLTVVVHFLGSLTTFICFAYLFHTVLACIFFPPRLSLAVTFMVCLLYVGCVAAELANIIPPASIYAEQANHSLRAELFNSPLRLSFHVGSAIGIFLVVWYLASNLSSAVRQRDHQLLIINERLLSADRERTQHMLHTTHELKAPFAAIQSYVQLLMKGYCGPLTDDSRDVLAKIDARSQRLSNQIREMLQLANLRSATAGARSFEQLDVAQILSRALAASQAQAQARDISFRTDLQKANVQGVAEQLEMMLANLLANAVQYSHPSGTVTVSSRQLEDGSARVQISDQGIGIRPDALPRIFEEYYRSKEAAQHNPMCTGLGLAIVKHIAQTHNIALRVESELAQGTTFILTFPRPKNIIHPDAQHTSMRDS
ncbi:MAG: hypothetical protein GWP14_01325 [Actinobacteria bacterium]|nr:hypothetical protein [Actinomycetota bacterium]